jgi:hypothetical protein
MAKLFSGLLLAVVSSILILGNTSTTEAGNAKGDFIKVEIQGTLKTGIVAIGGETTGTTITSGGITWELDLKKTKDLQELAEKLNGKATHVAGTLALRKGIEVRQRMIVTVTSLKAAKSD